MRGHDIDYYDQEGLWKNYLGQRSELKRAEIMLSLLPEDANSVLDVGCGNGILTDVIDRRCVVGLDLSRAPLRYLRSRAVQGSVDMLPIKPGKFDLIIISEVLEHLKDDIYSKAIRDIDRLKPKYLLISVPFWEDLRLSACKCELCGHIFNISHHCRQFDQDTIKDAFPGYSLEIAEYASFRPEPIQEWILLMQKLGIYSFSQSARCDLCGGGALRPNRPLAAIFWEISNIQKAVKERMGKTRPYHMIALLRRSESGYDGAQIE